MSRPGRRREAAPDAEVVVRYLRSHPDFLLRHPGLLGELRIADDRIGASSLLERQVALLRERLAELEAATGGSERRRMQEREAVAGLLEGLPQLVAAPSPAVMLAHLVHDLGRHAGAGVIRWHLFQDATADLPAPCRCYPRRHRLRDFFAQVFNVGRPLVDSLQAEHRQALFREAAGQVRSSVLLPLSGTDWEALLALGSAVPDRYRQGLELAAIRSLAVVTAARLCAR